MSIEIKLGCVYITTPDMGRHNAGIIADVIANYPQYAEEIKAALPAYEAAEAARIAEEQAQEQAEARRIDALREKQELEIEERIKATIKELVKPEAITV